jgi:hypothetical protein
MATEQHTEFYKYVPRLILEKLAEGLGDMFHAYFDGEPVLIGQSHLPALVVEWESTQPLPAPTRHDKWQHNLIIKVMVNKMDDAGMPDSVGQADRIIEVPTKKRLERYIFARDKATGQYIDQCVMGVLRKNFTMDGYTSNQVLNQLQFGNSRRPTLGNGDTESIQVPDRT